jgi:signal transduction histidine kinase
MITLDHPDWSELGELMGRFRDEALGSIGSTRGHADLIKQVLARRTEATTPEELARRIAGFADIMAVHMMRLERLIALLHRLELIRTGQLTAIIRANRRPVVLADLVEDLLEDLTEAPLLEEAPADFDLRDRLQVAIPGDVIVMASPAHLEAILRDLLRNSVMYSPPATPITIYATPSGKGRAVEIDVIDEGCGIRDGEAWRVFAPFERARQPQVIAEFGYGLSLYLAKAEAEAMGGRLGFAGQEGGTAFTLQLPVAKST